MFVVYCKACLPEKKVLGWGPKPEEIRSLPHEAHPSQSGTFELHDLQEWPAVHLPGHDELTRTFIGQLFGKKFL